MNLKNLIFPALFSAFWAGTAFADPSAVENPSTKETPHRVSHADEDHVPPTPRKMSVEDAKMLKKLFLMSDKELRRLREFIQHLEKMPPEYRRQMAEDLERAAVVKTPEQRKAFEKHMRERFRKNRENLLSRYYATLPPEEADAERKKFLSLSREERREYISQVRETLGYPPLPEKRRRGNAPASKGEGK